MDLLLRLHLAVKTREVHLQKLLRVEALYPRFPSIQIASGSFFCLFMSWLREALTQAADRSHPPGSGGSAPLLLRRAGCDVHVSVLRLGEAAIDSKKTFGINGSTCFFFLRPNRSILQPLQ